MSFKTLSSCLSSNSRGRVDEGLNGRYYRDDFNDYSWRCSAGTTDEDGIWLNQNDGAGTIMCLMVWILLGYSSLTITLLAQTGGIDVYQSFIYTIMVTMALMCHIKTTLTDPGSVPASAVPTEEQRKYEKLSMCSQCQTFKPPLSHHCRICNRCISRMDRKFSYYFLKKYFTTIDGQIHLTFINTRAACTTFRPLPVDEQLCWCWKY